MHFIAESDVFRVNVEAVEHPGGRHVIQLNVAFRDGDGKLIDSGKVEYTDTLRAMVPPGLSDDDLVFYAIRCVRFRKPHDSNDVRSYNWGSNNHEELLKTQAYTSDQLDYEILKKVHRFFAKDPALPLHRIDIELSVDAERTIISERISALCTLGYFTRAGLETEEFRFHQTTFNKLEARLEKAELLFRYGGYFREVPLPAAHAKPYVFVLMPFREEEFPQSVYNEVIKPTIQKATRINCLRADESQNAALITDQIYSQIKNANIIVAEITSLNPNVLVEIGIALSLGKQVYMFHDSQKRTRDKIPFYLSKVPTNGYETYDELKKELQKIEPVR